MNPKLSILVADDDAEDFVPELKDLLQSEYGDVNVDFAVTPAETTRLVRAKKYQFIILDISFHRGDYSGIVLAPKLKSIQPDTTVIMMSSRDDMETVMRCRNLGAVEFISKSNSAMSSVVQHIKTHKESAVLRSTDVAEGQARAESLGLRHVSLAMRDAFALVAHARRSPDLSVLVYGETGTGKEAIARAIKSDDKPYVTVDCGAVTESLAESAFFGHVKGSFTNAEFSKTGYLLKANGGAIFLDEIANLKPTVQEILLRAIQSKEVTPIGGKPTPFSARIICATNEDLDLLVESGRFRRDLLERLKGITIHLPPLRDRMEDFDGIVESILAELGSTGIVISENCMPFLKAYSWPGNIRELRRVLVHMIGRSRGPLLCMNSLPEEFMKNFERDLARTKSDGKTLQVSTAVSVDLDLKNASEIFERNFIQLKSKALNLGETSKELASSLGVSRATLYNKRGTAPEKLG